MASKAQATKEKLDKLIFSELNIFVLVHQEIKMYYTKKEWLQDTFDGTVIVRILRKKFFGWGFSPVGSVLTRRKS